MWYYWMALHSKPTFPYFVSFYSPISKNTAIFTQLKIISNIKRIFRSQTRMKLKGRKGLGSGRVCVCERREVESNAEAMDRNREEERLWITIASIATLFLCYGGPYSLLFSAILSYSVPLTQVYCSVHNSSQQRPIVFDWYWLRAQVFLCTQLLNEITIQLLCDSL